MNRRQLVIAASVLAIAPLRALAQPTTRIPTVGLLWSDFAWNRLLQVFREDLKSRGYVEQKTILIESRHLVQTSDELDSAAERLVAQKVDVILAIYVPAVRAARKATQTIPIVAIMPGDPVEAGFAESLARPGGNVTGVMYLGLALQVKRLEILKDAVPGLRRVAVLIQSLELRRTQSALHEAAAQLGLTIITVVVPTAADIDTGLTKVMQSGAQAIFWGGGTVFGRHHRAIVEAVAKTRLPAIYPQSGYARVGGMMSYAYNQTAHFLVAANYVDRILRGAKPADLPFEQASKFDFVLNLQAAKAQGIRIPETTLLRATEVIE